MAETGKSSMGWFYGFKLHLICNDKGELLNFCICIDCLSVSAQVLIRTTIDLNNHIMAI